MAPLRDELFPTVDRQYRVGTLTPPGQESASSRSTLSPSTLLDRLGRATTARQRLRDATAAVARAGDEEELLRDLVRHAQRVVICDGTAFFRAEQDGTLAPVTPSDRGIGQLPLPASASQVAADASHSGRPVREVVRASVADDAGSTAHAMLAVPMRVGTQLLGVLLTWTAADTPHDVADEDRLMTLASAGSSTLAHLRREAQGERERREIEALVDVSRAAAASLRFGETMRLILRHASALTRADGALISLREGGYLHVRAVHGCVSLLAGVHMPIEGSLMGRALSEGAPVICNDCRGEAAVHKSVADIKLVERAVIVPLTTESGTIGTLVVVNRALPFDDTDARVLHRLADLVAVAIINARLFEAVEQATREWRAAVDAIDAGFFVLDDEHRIVRCNARAVGIAGLKAPREAIGQRFEQVLLGSTELTWFEPTVAMVLREQLPLRGVTRAGADGRSFTLSVAPHPNGGVVVTADEELDDAVRVVTGTAGATIAG
jgi:GAF domain-containing protein